MHQLHCHWHSHCQFRNSICAIVFIEIENLNQNCSCIFGMLRPHSYVETRGRDSSSSCNKIESMEHRDMHTKAAHTAIHSFKYMAPGFPCTGAEPFSRPQSAAEHRLVRIVRSSVLSLMAICVFPHSRPPVAYCLFLSAQQGGHRPAEMGAAVQMGTPLARRRRFLGRPSLLSLVLRGSLRHVRVFFF